MPAPERALWSTLTERNRDVALDRLEALTAYEDEGGLLARLEKTGLSKRGFFTLLKRWRADRSIASLLPRAGGIGRTAPADSLAEDLLAAMRAEVRKDVSRDLVDLVADVEKALPELRGAMVDGKPVNRVVRAILLDTVVSDLLASHPDWTKHRIVEAARSRMHEPPAASTVRRVVERLRAAPTTGLGDGAFGFGSHVLIASCPAVRRASRSTENETWAHVGLVVDVATRTILGGTAAPRAFDAMMAAAEQAADFCEGLIDGEGSGPSPVLKVLVPDDADVMVLMKQSAAVRRVAKWEQAEHPTNRTTPSLLVGLVGRSLGVLDLRPRGAPEAAAEEPRIVADLVARHLDRTRKPAGSLPPASVPQGALVAALRAFAA